MISIFRLYALLVIGILMAGEATAQPNKQMVRLAAIRVDSTQLNSYSLLLKEEIDASIKKEAGY